MYGGATSAATTEPATEATGGIVAGAPDPLGVARDQDAGTEGTPRIANLKERMRRKRFAVLQSLKLECNSGDDAPQWMQNYEDLRILSLRIISQESQLPLASMLRRMRQKSKAVIKAESHLRNRPHHIQILCFRSIDSFVREEQRHVLKRKCAYVNDMK